MEERELLVNSIMCPDGTILVSRHLHDYVEHVQEDGRSYFVDGGMSYQRMGYSDNEYTDLCVYTDDSHEKIRDSFYWTQTMDKHGNMLPEPKTLKLKDLEDGHVEALCYYTSKGYPAKVNKVFVDEHNWRIDNKGGEHE